MDRRNVNCKSMYLLQAAKQRKRWRPPNATLLDLMRPIHTDCLDRPMNDTTQRADMRTRVRTVRVGPSRDIARYVPLDEQGGDDDDVG